MHAAPGDLFTSPPPADIYVLARVLHDWDDEHARQILTSLGGASRGSRLRIFERLLPDDDTPDRAKLSDVAMLLLFGGGRERTAGEYRELLERAGWRLDQIVTNPGGMSIIEASPHDRLMRPHARPCGPGPSADRHRQTAQDPLAGSSWPTLADGRHQCVRSQRRPVPGPGRVGASSAAPAAGHSAPPARRRLDGMTGGRGDCSQGARQWGGVRVAGAACDDQITWPTAERTAPDLACVIADGYSVSRWIDGKEKVYGSIP